MSAAAPARASLVPPFTDEHEELRASIRRFVEHELAPRVNEWERERWFPNDVFAKLGASGFLGLKYPVEYGGQGGDYLHDAVFTEELARCGSGGVAAGIGAHVGIATPPIWKFGTDHQKEHYLAGAIKGELIGALAITEPDAGSDVAAIKTTAIADADGYRVNGSKVFITNGVRADFLVTAVKTSAQGGHHGLSFLIIDRGEGIESTKLDKMGWHASDTALIHFDDVFVPRENLLGGEDQGFYLIMANFQWERLLMALGSVAAMALIFERTLDYAKERRAFGRAIGSHQAIRHKLAEMSMTIETGRALTYHALRLFTGGIDATREVTMAKLATQRAAFEIADTALQIFGGAGYMQEYEIERYARDARLGPIGGGTDEIMREILSKIIGL